jgi:hypothetical protein
MQLPVADAKERTRTTENARDIEKKVAGSDSFINLTLNYLLHFTCMRVYGVCRQWNRDNVRKRQ